MELDNELSAKDQPYFPPDLQPTIISRKDHSISRHLIDPDALNDLYRLKNHGFLAYLVGGGVRDILLDKQPKDYDIATDAQPKQIRSLFRNSRIIGRRFQLAQVYFNGGKIIEVSTFRKSVPFLEEEETNGQDNSDNPDGQESPQKKRWMNENTFGTPREDALRRDITINALFYNIEDYSIIDYVGGMDDLRNCIIRSVGCPNKSFMEDPARMMRVIRHAARTGFQIEENTLEAIRRHRSSIIECSRARVREEFLRELRGGCSYGSFSLMMETGFLCDLFPAYEPVLNGPFGENVRACLLENLRGVDHRRQQGEEMSDQMLLAALVAPFVIHGRILEGAPQGKRRIAFFHEEVREIIKPIVRDFGFSKGHAEEICQSLVGMLLLEMTVMMQEKLPRSISRKVYFQKGYQLFQIRYAGKNRPIPPDILRLWHQAQSAPQERFASERGNGGDPAEAYGNRRRHRRRGRRRPFISAEQIKEESPAVSDIQETRPQEDPLLKRDE